MKYKIKFVNVKGAIHNILNAMQLNSIDVKTIIKKIKNKIVGVSVGLSSVFLRPRNNILFGNYLKITVETTRKLSQYVKIYYI